MVVVRSIMGEIQGRYLHPATSDNRISDKHANNTHDLPGRTIELADLCTRI